ncbi:MAG TPA: dUTP diphosphatase [Clostridiales bacterium]|nr:dUTP diphosphatase [Clostridiales bacterium]
MTSVSIKRLDSRAKLPVYSSEQAAGADLYALCDQSVDIAPGETALIRTGLALAIPQGYVGLVYARSGLATKQGLAPANKVGVIDSDYRGELMVALYNQSGQVRTVSCGDRIAQLVITPYLTAQFEEREALDDTQRGAGGFGSTGLA